MLTIERVTCRLGGRLILDEASASVPSGQRVGLVGRNGAGKTTLLRLLSGENEPDSGSINTPARWRVGVTSQEAPSGDASLVDCVMGGDRELVRLRHAAEHESDPDRLAEVHARLADLGAHEAHARAASILAGLGFDHAAQQRPLDEFSGGWRMRVALASLLFAAPDLLLLDEPTNHLDLEASLWLEDYLRRFRGTVLLVSHDRDLLNRAVDSILHLEAGKLTLYRGGYDDFDAARRMRQSQDARARTRQEGERARIQAFVDRFRAKATKARQAQSRLKMLARMQPIAAPITEESVEFTFPEVENLAPPLLSLDDVAAGYDGTPVLRRMSMSVDPEDRIALLGANGNGKSTLLRLLAGRLAPIEGRIVRPPKLRVGYFAQHQSEELDLTVTPIVELSRRRPRDPEQRVRSHLGHFGFSQTRAQTTIGKLSGGEKARLLFALMSADAPQVLLLDEPTNHLDIEARQALVEAINAFAGAVIIVSHDANLVELVADRLWLVAGGSVMPFEGDMDDYRARVLASGDGASSRPAPAEDSRLRRKASAGQRATLAPLKRKATDAEAVVERLSARKAAIERDLADPALYAGPPARLVALKRDLARASAELAAAEDAWLAAQAAYEAASLAAD